jgi:hypothetical protein
MAVFTFKDFFEDRFLGDRAFRRFQPYYFQTFYEMAIQGDVPRIPVNIDKDDIEFLRQFPSYFWKQALHQRYDKLFHLLRGLHRERVSHPDFATLKTLIKQALDTENWDILKGKMSDDGISHLKTYHSDWSEKEKEGIAERAAFEEVKQRTDRVPDPEVEEFKLSGKRGKETVFRVKPFFNRLYHKLERTRGVPHAKDSGLEGKGQYGYDMSYPLEGKEGLPHTTGAPLDGQMGGGFQFPSKAQVDKVISDFLNLNMHRMFGDLPEDVEWRKMDSKDTWTIRLAREKLQQEVYEELFHSGKFGEKGPPKDVVEDEVERRLADMAQRGVLKGPPVPGVAPDGLPIEVKDGHVVPPPLYLPGEKRNGVWTPIVNPAHYFRPVGTHPEDFERDGDGKLVLRDGKPVIAVSKDKLRGHKKDHVALPDMAPVLGDPGQFEYKKGRPRHYAPGAFHFTQNTPSRKYLSKGDPGYQEAYEKVFGDQERVELGPGNKILPAEGGTGFFRDIIEGILQCASTECGGSGQFERAKLRGAVDDVHDEIMQLFLMKLADERLYTPGGRRGAAKSYAGSWVQQDHGEGTRRQREAGRRKTVSKDAEQGGEGSGFNIGQTLADRGGEGTARGSARRGRGGRRLPTGHFEFNYSIHNMRRFLHELEQASRQADETSHEARQAARKEVGERIIQMLRKGADSKATVIVQLISSLTELLQLQGMTPEAAGKEAEQLVTNWTSSAKTSEQLVAAFEQHPLVQQMMRQQVGQLTPGQDKPPTEQEQEAIEQAHEDLEKMRRRGIDPSSPQGKAIFLAHPGEEFSAYVNTEIAKIYDDMDPDELEALKRRVQAELNKIVGGKPASTAAAAKEIKTADKPAAAPPAPAAAPAPKPAGPPRPDLSPEAIGRVSPKDLYEQKRFLELAHHPEYLKVTHVENLKRLLGWLDKNKASIDPADYASAQRSLQGALKSRGAA